MNSEYSDEIQGKNKIWKVKFSKLRFNDVVQGWELFNGLSDVIIERLLHVAFLYQKRCYKSKSFVPEIYINRIFRNVLSYAQVISILTSAGLLGQREEIQQGYRKRYLYPVTDNILSLKSVPLEFKKNIKLIQNNLHYLRMDEIPLERSLSKIVIRITDEELRSEIELYKEQNPKKSKPNFKRLRERINNFNNERETELIKIKFDVKTWAGRRYHIFTNTPPFLRKYTYPRLFELDIINCQAVMLAGILDKILPSNDYSRIFYEENIDFYKVLNPADRDKGKLMFFKTVFSPYEDKYFADVFPEANYILTDVRAGRLNILDNDNDRWKVTFTAEELYLRKKNKLSRKQCEVIARDMPLFKSICYMCTKWEIKIFEHVWRRLLNQGIIFLFVHDAVYVQCTKLHMAMNIMNEEIRRQIGPDSPIKFKIRSEI